MTSLYLNLMQWYCVYQKYSNLWLRKSIRKIVGFCKCYCKPSVVDVILAVILLDMKTRTLGHGFGRGVFSGSHFSSEEIPSRLSRTRMIVGLLLLCDSLRAANVTQKRATCHAWAKSSNRAQGSCPKRFVEALWSVTIWLAHHVSWSWDPFLQSDVQLQNVSKLTVIMIVVVDLLITYNHRSIRLRAACCPQKWSIIIPYYVLGDDLSQQIIIYSMWTLLFRF